MALQKLDQLIDIAKNKETRRLAVAAAADEHVLEAVKSAVEARIVKPILVGETEAIRKIAAKINFDLTGIEIIEEANPVKASVIAVALIKEGKAEILMKGLVATAPLLKAVLDKEKGLRKGGTLSHFALFETPFYHKLLGVTDAAMNVAPEFNDKVAILNNSVDAMHGLGIANPKVAVIGPLEVVNPKIESTVHAAMLTLMNNRKQITGCIVDGPFALDNAVSKEAAEHKGIISPVAGDADILMGPELNACNILYKSLNFLGGATSAAVIMGATVPIVLTSRADTERAKFLSIAMAAAMA
ncbi:MAG: bifunctional enoyl-CoA hydratase/phosphate acetyltransferase [Bacteroidales bacterium]|nr:bifunctional enoyl-CoA hydratase/phosphate acetyltransferase [Bacteroidales bacterium]